MNTEQINAENEELAKQTPQTLEAEQPASSLPEPPSDDVPPAPEPLDDQPPVDSETPAPPLDEVEPPAGAVSVSEASVPEASVEHVPAAEQPPAPSAEPAAPGPVAETSPDALPEVPADEVAAEEPHTDYASFTKQDFVKQAEDALSASDSRLSDEVLRHAKPAFDEMKEAERVLALERFVAGGGDKDDFEFKYDGLTVRFDNLCRQLREKKAKWAHDQERSKENNQQAKQALLERLRRLVDGEESHASAAEFKKIQQEWKTTGPVPPAQSQEFWASYNALVERFYSNRSIFHELKELDRKKNLELKLEICDKAEKLLAQPISAAVVKELNELHEEFRHVGPVPREEQEAVWQRFKAASDVVYARRKEQMDALREQMEVHVVAKRQLCEAVEPLAHFQSDKIGEWNEKTRELLDLQKKWDEAGLLPREKAKEINKRFWTAFKQFFHRKNEFFRHLEAAREENMRLKTSLCEQAEALRDNEELDATAEQIKQLQVRWKEIGPVPEKFRDPVFERFKQACDAFFDRRRNQRNQSEREFDKNFAAKSDICARIEALAAEKSTDAAALGTLREQYESIGFVPRKQMDAIRKRYADAVRAFLDNAPGLSEGERTRMQHATEPRGARPASRHNESRHNDSRYGESRHGESRHGESRHSESRFASGATPRDSNRAEHGMRRKITQLENDIALWRNNLEFFARAKNADAVRKEFTGKIEAAEDELKDLKQQMKQMNDQ